MSQHFQLFYADGKADCHYLAVSLCETYRRVSCSIAGTVYAAFLPSLSLCSVAYGIAVITSTSVDTHWVHLKVTSVYTALCVCVHGKASLQWMGGMACMFFPMLTPPSFLSSVSHQPDQPLSHQKAAIARGRIFAVWSVTEVTVIEHSPETVHKCAMSDEGG